MRVLVACEFSGIVRDAFIAAGHDAVCCDLIPCERPERPYIVADVIGIIYGTPKIPPKRFDLMIAHPPCQFLCSSGLHWNTRIPGREKQTEKALAFVRKLLDAPIPKIALENPIGRIGTAIRKADQIIQPWQFGEDASKATALWLKNLPPLTPTQYVQPRLVNGKKRWGNQTDSGQNKLGPSETRSQDRARTYAGIARAMAEQWGKG